MQFIKLFQVSHCRNLQEVEVILAEIAEIVNVTKEVGAPVVPSGKWLEFGVAHSRVKMKVSFQAARSIG
jgi:hypothetical protein